MHENGEKSLELMSRTLLTNLLLVLTEEWIRKHLGDPAYFKTPRLQAVLNVASVLENIGFGYQWKHSCCEILVWVYVSYQQGRCHSCIPSTYSCYKKAGSWPRVVFWLFFCNAIWWYHTHIQPLCFPSGPQRFNLQTFMQWCQMDSA